jgi:hypothetical protein
MSTKETTVVMQLRANYGAYEYLRDHDLSAVSSTSRLLRARDLTFLLSRARGEIDELRGAIDGTHRHAGGQADIVLEAYQSVYWLLLVAGAGDDSFDDLRLPDNLFSMRADAAITPDVQPWPSPDDIDDPARRRAFVRQGLALVAALCRNAGVDPDQAVQRDTMELRKRPYLASYWTAWDRREKNPGEESTGHD